MILSSKKTPLQFNLLVGIIASCISTTSAQQLDQAAYVSSDYSHRFTENALAPIHRPARTIYVSINGGDDANIGSAQKPLKNLRAAQLLVRKLRETEGSPKGGFEVKIAAGDYHLNTPLELGPEDSGTKESPTVWSGVKRDQVIVSGGTQISTKQSAPIQGGKIFERLHPKARGNVIGLDLSQTDTSVFNFDGAYPHVAMNGHMLQLAQWPNIGYHHIRKVHDKGPSTRMLKPGEKPAIGTLANPVGGKFTFRERLNPAVAEEFSHYKEMRVEGYFHNDWYFQNEPVGHIEKGVVQLKSATRYGISDEIKGLPRRVRLVNVLAELDQPGEWYYDQRLKGLLFWPIPDANLSRSHVSIPGGDTLISLNNTKFITIRNLIFENSGKTAVRIRGGSHNLVANSTVRNGQNLGIAITNGTYNGISGCNFHDLHKAFSIQGGNFKTLERCYNFATNNQIHDCRLRGYGVVRLKGVGLYFANNLLHDMNGAVSYNTADLLMERNEFYNIGYEMGDFNVAYCGAQWHSMNNVLRHNFVHHLLEPGGHPVCPFRNDDGGAGLKIYGNIFYRAGRCAAQFDGPANTLQNNISLEAPILWWTLKRPIKPKEIQQAWDDLARFGRDLPQGDKGDFLYNLEQRIGPEGWKQSPWKEQFPELASFIKINPWAQTHCYIERNYSTKMHNSYHIHGGDGTVRGMESRKSGSFKDLPKEGVFELPAEIKLRAFQNVSKLDFSLKSSFRPMKGFRPIPFEKIGLYRSPYRRLVPDKDTYRSAVYKRFKKDVAGKYHPKIVNARYPIPTYLR